MFVFVYCYCFTQPKMVLNTRYFCLSLSSAI